MMNLLETAFYWKSAGFSTIPIRFRDKRPEVKWDEYVNRLPTDNEIKQWYASKLHNIALITGQKGLVVIDFDDVPAYSSWLMWTTRSGGIQQLIAEQTHQVRTARGVHVYLRLPHAEKNRKLNKIDIKAERGYVLIPPSIHPSGRPYTILKPGPPFMIEALSDAFPSNQLQQHTELADNVIIPGRATLPVNNDPWAVASNQTYNNDLVTKLRDHFKIQDFFTDKESSSRNNRWFLTRCPFHTDKNPSFWIDTKQEICGCHAGCTLQPLDVINLYARLYSLDNNQAILALRKAL